jgi:V/A-type H+-transporting ATPase subunit A
MMKVVGEEGTSLDDFIVYLKAEYVDAVYLQQDAYHEIDAATPRERQQYVFAKIAQVLKTKLKFGDKPDARAFFQRLTRTTRDWNRVRMDTEEFQAIENAIDDLIAGVTDYA